MDKRLQLDETSLGITESPLIPSAALSALVSDPIIRKEVTESLKIRNKQDKKKLNGMNFESGRKGAIIGAGLTIVVFGLAWLWFNPWAGFAIGFGAGFVANTACKFGWAKCCKVFLGRK